MMSLSDDDTDKVIRAALEQEESETPRDLEDPSMAELLTETFRGRHRRVAMGGAALNLLLFVAAVSSAIQFFRAPDVREMLLWSGATFLCFGLVLAIKVWYWLEMVRLAITRDVKRLELQVSRLAEIIGEGQSQ
ncbi:MAG TPA: DUF6768 family protein [Gemmatimonadaceae bacterium]